MLKKLRTVKILADVSSDQQNSGLEANVIVDRDTASRLGLSQQAIDDTLYDAFGQRQVSTMYTPLNQYHVVMEVAPQFWQNPDSLDLIYVRSSTGGLVRLSTFTHFANDQTALAVNHQGQFPSVTISFNLAPGVALGEAVDAITQAEAQIKMPAGIRGTFQGTAQAFQDSLKNEGFLIAFALFAVYIVLGILYESYIHPITILSTLPSAGVGAIARAAAFPHRAERDRAYRHHPADRHRQEKRHHDDRLRARSSTRRRANRRTMRSTRHACCASVRS